MGYLHSYHIFIYFIYTSSFCFYITYSLWSWVLFRLFEIDSRPFILPAVETLHFKKNALKKSSLIYNFLEYVFVGEQWIPFLNCKFSFLKTSQHYFGKLKFKDFYCNRWCKKKSSDLWFFFAILANWNSPWVFNSSTNISLFTKLIFGFLDLTGKSFCFSQCVNLVENTNFCNLICTEFVASLWDSLNT